MHSDDCLDGAAISSWQKSKQSRSNCKGRTYHCCYFVAKYY